MKKIFLFLLILFCAGAGCTYTQRSSEGPLVSSAHIQDLKIGQTTETDLHRLLGPPTNRERRSDGTEIWRYIHTRILNPTLGGAVVLEPFQREVEETFEVVLKNGAVQSYRFIKQADGGKE